MSFLDLNFAAAIFGLICALGIVAISISALAWRGNRGRAGIEIVRDDPNERTAIRGVVEFGEDEMPRTTRSERHPQISDDRKKLDNLASRTDSPPLDTSMAASSSKT